MGLLRRLSWPYLNPVLLRRFVAGFGVVYVLGLFLTTGSGSDPGIAGSSPLHDPAPDHGYPVESRPSSPTASPAGGSGASDGGSGAVTFAIVVAIALVVLLAAYLALRWAQRRSAKSGPSSPPGDAPRREIPYSLQLGSTALGMLSAAATVVRTFSH